MANKIFDFFTFTNVFLILINDYNKGKLQIDKARLNKLTDFKLTNSIIFSFFVAILMLIMLTILITRQYYELIYFEITIQLTVYLIFIVILTAIFSKSLWVVENLHMGFC